MARIIHITICISIDCGQSSHLSYLCHLASPICQMTKSPEWSRCTTVCFTSHLARNHWSIDFAHSAQSNGAVLVAKCCKPAIPLQWACDQLHFLISLIIIINVTCYLCYHKESFRWRQTQARKLLNFVEKLKAFSPSECHLLSPVRTLQLIPH